MPPPRELVQRNVVVDDGTVPFVAPQAGVDPTAAEHLATKNYVDAFGGGGALPDNSVTDAKLRDSGACSVIGRSANSSGDPADIAAASDGFVMRRAAGVLGFGTLLSTSFADNTIAHSRLVNMTAAGYLGATGSGQVREVNHTTPSSSAPTASEILHKHASDGSAITRCTVQQLLDLIGTYFGLTPP